MKNLLVLILAPAIAWSQFTVSRPGGGGGGGGGSSATTYSALTTFKPVQTSTTLLTITCSTTSPCNAKIGPTVYSFVGTVTITLSGSANGTLVLYIDSAGVFTAAAATGTITLTCSGCTTAVASTFPATAVPIGTWTATAGTWDTNGWSDKRAPIQTTNIIGGYGITVTANSPAIDTSVGNLLTRGAALPATCTPPQFYVLTTTSTQYDCTAANTWTAVGGGSSSAISGMAWHAPDYAMENGGAMGAGLNANQVWAYQFRVDAAITVSTVGISINTASGTCGGTCGARFAIWNSAGTTKVFETAALTSGGSPDINGTGRIAAANSAGSITIQAGTYWAAFTTTSTAIRIFAPNAGGYSEGFFAWRSNNSPAGTARNGGAANASTGTGGSIAFASTLGAVTADNDYSKAPAFLLW